jgi:putative transposase
VEEVCRKHDVSQSTLFRWRGQHGGRSTPEAKRLKELERENGHLKAIAPKLIWLLPGHA